ncbi:hypothetical protein [Actinokineospora sp. NPDC004072]
METPPAPGSRDGRPDGGVDDPSATRNTLSGSAAASVQARDIRGGVAQHYHSPGRWGWTALLTSLLILGGVLLVVTTREDEPPVPDGDPLFATVQPITDPCLSDWFTTRPAEQVRARHDGGEPRSWTDLDYLADGASAEVGKVVVTLQGRQADRSVTITGMAVEVLSRAPPPPGIVLDAPCADAELYRYVEVDLDAERPRPVGRPVDPNAAAEAARHGWRAEPVAFPYEISSTDAESFVISAATELCDCTWIVHFDWSSGGRTGRLTLPGDGGAFRVVAGAGAPRCSTLPGLVCR